MTEEETVEKEVTGIARDVAEATESVGDRDRLTTAPEAAPVEMKPIPIHPAAITAPENARIAIRVAGMIETGNGTVETDDKSLDAMMTTELLLL